MQYIGTFFWSVLLVSLLNYVVSAVQNVDFNFMLGIYVAAAVTILIFIMSFIIPESPASEKH